MITQELLDYIKQQLKEGVSEEEIKNSLLANDWQEKDIEEAFNSIRRGDEGDQSDLDSVEGRIYPQSNISSAQPRKKTIAVIISIILGVAIVGGSVFGYFYYFQSPERIFQKMIENMAKVKSAEYSGKLTAEVKISGLSNIFSTDNAGLENPKNQLPTETKTGKFFINFSGASDLHDLNKPKAKFALDISTKTLPHVFGLEARGFKDAEYFKVTNVPNLGLFDLSFLKNQWIKLDSEAIINNLEGGKLEEPTNEVQNNQKLTPEQIKLIKEAFRRAKIFRITEKLASEKINGIKTHHYKVTVDKKELIQLIYKISRIENKSPTEKELQELNKSLQAIEIPEAEIWIGKKDLLLYKILLELNIKEAEKVKLESKITVSVQFKNYNQPVQIEAPSSSKSGEEIIEKIADELVGGLFGKGLQELEQNFQMPRQLPAK